MIIVTGTGRSGTSTVARLLHTELGLPMGTDDSLETEPSAACPRGSYEDREFREAHIQVQRGGMTLPAFRRRVKELVEAREAEFGSPWGFKDPRASHVLGLYLQWFNDVRVVLCERDTEAVVGSWLRVTTAHHQVAATEIQSRADQLRRLLEALLPSRQICLQFPHHRSDQDLLEGLRPLLPCPTPSAGDSADRMEFLETEEIYTTRPAVGLRASGEPNAVRKSGPGPMIVKHTMRATRTFDAGL